VASHREGYKSLGRAPGGWCCLSLGVAQADETAVVSGLQENDKVQVKCLAEFFTILGPLHFHSELTEQKAARSAPRGADPAADLPGRSVKTCNG
jgi:hypothetical protein